MPRSLLLLLAVTGSAVLGAAPLYVSAAGRFSTADLAGPLVSPGGIFSLTFAIDGNPTPIAGTVTTLGFDAPILDFHYTLNTIDQSVLPGEIRFNTLSNGGLFDVTFGSGLSASELSFTGEQAFSGSTFSPAFTPGQYSLLTWTFSDSNNYDFQSPLGANVTVMPVPEPASIPSLLGGLAGLACVLRQRRSRSV